jgi:hypothetical protein
MAVQIQLRRGTESAWTAANPLLADGEMGLESDTAKFKIGDGVTYWNSLVYGGIAGADGTSGNNGIDAVYDTDQSVISARVFSS